MKICLLVIGKTDADYIRAGIEEYEKRLRKYVGYEMKVLPDVKNTKHMSEALQKEKEGLLLLEQFLPTDYVILLDERGKQYGSGEFSAFLAQKMLNGIKRLVFIENDFLASDGPDDFCRADLSGDDHYEGRALSS